jgi:hypothetical protein
MVTNACNSSTQEAKAGGLRVQGQPGLHSETLSQKNYKVGRGEFIFHELRLEDNY